MTAVAACVCKHAGVLLEKQQRGERMTNKRGSKNKHNKRFWQSEQKPKEFCILCPLIHRGRWSEEAAKDSHLPTLGKYLSTTKA